MRELEVCLRIVGLPKIAGSNHSNPKAVQMTPKGLWRKNDTPHLVFLSRNCTFRKPTRAPLRPAASRNLSSLPDRWPEVHGLQETNDLAAYYGDSDPES